MLKETILILQILHMKPLPPFTIGIFEYTLNLGHVIEAILLNEFRVVQHMVEQVAALGGQRCNVIVASHNETSVLKALSKMESLGILPTDNTVVFGQIYGMASNITVKLGILHFFITR